MPNERNERQEEIMAKKSSRPNYVNINIREADNHYIASFHHGPPRIFHDMEELLVAIETEVKRIK